MEASKTNVGAGLKVLKGVKPGDKAAGTVNGSGIDRTGFESCVLQVSTGDETGSPTARTVDAKIQDSADNSTFADYVPPRGVAADAAIAQITAANTEKHKDVDLSGARQYIRVVETVGFTGGTSPKVGVACNLVLGGAVVKPVASY